MIEPKPITSHVRKLGWQPTRTMRMPGGKLQWSDDQTLPGILAFGDRYDYSIVMDGTTASVGQWPEGVLFNGRTMPEPTRAVRYATVPNATETQMIRMVEEWEATQ